MCEGASLNEMIFDESGRPVNYRILDVNAAYEKLTAIKQTDTAGQLASDLYGTREPPLLDEIAQVLKSGEIRFFEFHWPPIEKDYKLSVHPAGKTKFFVLFRDITELKKSTEILQNNKQKYEALLANSNELTILTDKEGIVSYISPQSLQVLGYPVDRFIGKAFPDIIYPDDIPLCRKAWEEVLHGNPAFLRAFYR